MKKGEPNWWYTYRNTGRLHQFSHHYFYWNANTSLERDCFPNQLELAEMTPVLKKEDELSKENYRQYIWKNSPQQNESFF